MAIKSVKVPKHARKYVYWKPGGPMVDGGVLVYLVGYCPDTLSYFIAMFRDASKSVPNLDASTAICGKVKRSDSVAGFTIMMIDVDGPKRTIEGFEECK